MGCTLFCPMVSQSETLWFCLHFLGGSTPNQHVTAIHFLSCTQACSSHPAPGGISHMQRGLCDTWAASQFTDEVFPRPSTNRSTDPQVFGPFLGRAVLVSSPDWFMAYNINASHVHQHFQPYGSKNGKNQKGAHYIPSYETFGGWINLCKFDP